MKAKLEALNYNTENAWDKLNQISDQLEKITALFLDYKTNNDP